MAVGAEGAVNGGNEFRHDPVHLGGNEAPNGIGKAEQDSPVLGCPTVDFL
jgi:hypothetical protein